MNDEMKSIRAIKECMEDLGLHPNEKPAFEVDARIHNPANDSFGSITVTFKSNWHSVDGPYIEVDDTIKGYDIQYTSFKPKWQSFDYSKETKKMKVNGDKYSFVLVFE